jgi:hypothetical protein
MPNDANILAQYGHCEHSRTVNEAGYTRSAGPNTSGTYLIKRCAIPGATSQTDDKQAMQQH